jgi:hypothetical protein
MQNIPIKIDDVHTINVVNKLNLTYNLLILLTFI